MNIKSAEENHSLSVSDNESKKIEKKLIRAAQNGDNAAFGKLIRLHQKRLFKFIYGLLRDFDTVEDIVQESFVKAYHAIKTFRTEYSFYPWLSTIARNLAYNHVAREEKKESLEKLQDAGFAPPSLKLGPLDELIESENGKRFYEALSEMSSKYSSVFVLRHFEQMDYAEIASYLKIPPGTVDSRLFRARQILMEKLKEFL